MFEFVLGYLLTWPFIAMLVVAGILFEHNECSGWAVFTGMVAAVVAYCYFKIPLIDVATGAVAYVVLGVLWSFYRYKRYVSKKVADILAYVATANVSDTYKQTQMSYLHPSKMLGPITSWIIIWPFSVIENLVGDIISSVETLVKTVFKGVYNKIYASAMKDLGI